VARSSGSDTEEIGSIGREIESRRGIGRRLKNIEIKSCQKHSFLYPNAIIEQMPVLVFFFLKKKRLLQIFDAKTECARRAAVGSDY
jgi:hypothetical protein